MKKPTDIPMTKMATPQKTATDELLETLQAKRAETESALQAFRAVTTTGSLRADEYVLRKSAAEILYRRAQDNEADARLAASRAVDADEVARGDALARARDVQTYLIELAELVAEEDEARAVLIAAEARTRDRMDRARAAHAPLVARRESAGLPPPVQLPEVAMGFAGQRDSSPRAMLQALEQRIEEGPPSPRRMDERIRRLQREETLARASLEQQRLEREQADAERAQRRANDAREATALMKKASANRAALEREAKARADLIANLAQQHRDREPRESQ